MSEKSKFRNRGHGASGLSVGRKVFVRFGKKKRLVRIIEDRGNIGRNGRRLLRVAFALPYGAPEQVFEIAADDVTRQYSPRKKRPKVAAH